MTFELCSWSQSQQPPQATTSTLCLHVHIYKYVHIMYLIHASTLKSANGKRVWIICNESTGRPQLHLYKRAVLHKHNCVRSRTILYTHMYIHVYSIYVFLFHSVIIIFFCSFAISRTLTHNHTICQKRNWYSEWGCCIFVCVFVLASG